MRYQYSLTKLADIIASHSAESLRREIQLTAASSMELAEKQPILQNLRHAHSFITTHPALPENWRTSFNCFKDLAYYFIQQDENEASEEKAMCCWYLLLNQTIPLKIKTNTDEEITNNFPYEEIIMLGKAYLHEPYQFAGFICWLLIRQVNPHIIKASALLRQLFNYHSWDLSTLTHTYDLIKKFSQNSTNSFLMMTNTTPCLSQGFTNNPPVKHIFILTAALIPMPSERAVIYIRNNNGTVEYSALGMKEIGKIEAYEFLDEILDLTKPAVQNRISIIAFERGHTSRAHSQHESYNVKGTLFAHQRPLLPPDDSSEDEMESAILPQHALILLQLFGFEFIKTLLSSSEEAYSNALLTLLKSPFKDTILNELPSKALSGEISYLQAYALLAQIGLAYSYQFDHFGATTRSAFSINSNDGSMRYPEEAPLQKDLIALVESNPFYIHVKGVFSLPTEIIDNAVMQLLSDVNNKNTYHIPFLVSLSKKLKNKNLLECHQRVIDFIGEYLFEIGNELHDSYDSVLQTIDHQLSPLFEKKLASYAENIDHAIDDYLSEKIDYYILQQIACSQLSFVNLIKRLIPHLLLTIDYPHGSYALKNLILEKSFLWAKQNGFDYPTTLNRILCTMSDTVENKIRILQECLQASNNTDYLKEIIRYALKEDDVFIATLFHNSFGHESHVLDAIISIDNTEFREWALSVIPPSNEAILAIIKRYVDEGVSEKIERFLQSPHLAQKTAYDAILFIAHTYEGSIHRWAILEKYIMLIQQPVFARELIEMVFIEAVKNASEKVLLRLCNLENDAHFPKEIIEAQAIILMLKKKWGLVHLLCGLSGKTTNDKIITKNNVDLLVKILEARVNSATLCELYQKDIITQAHTLCDNQNTLFHLSAKSGSYDTVVNTLSFFEKHLTPRTIYMFLYAKNETGEIPHCPEALSDAEKINVFLNQKRSQYEEKYNFSVTDGGLWRNPQDHKRMRSEPDHSETDDEIRRLLDM
ncbi:MAG: hypothetical protein Q8L78_07340 [Coxiellaceae bacterium]|nr:hypothetical protein [Coxiellaceae bacterium]